MDNEQEEERAGEPDAPKGKRWTATPFSRYIKAQRELFWKSQTEFAEAVNLDQGYISQLEGGRPPSTALVFLVPYAKALRTPTQVLVNLLKESGVVLDNPYDVDIEQLDADLANLLAQRADLTPPQIKQLYALAVAMAEENARAKAGSPHQGSVEKAPQGGNGSRPKRRADAKG